jgi:lipoate-protein ligase A
MAPGGPPVLSWSSVTAPGLVLGRHAVEPALDADAVAAEGVTVLTRSSGGGPVLWDGDLVALDVVLPRGHRLAADDVVAAYRWLGEALADALRALGAPDVEVVDVARARAWKAAPGPAADACFGGLSPWEVLAGGRKVVGLSQTRRRRGALLQAGIPLTLDAARLGRLLGRDAAWARGLAATAAGLRELVPGVRDGDVVAAADAAIAGREGVRYRTRTASPG